jgi:hypothetical protein
LSSSSYLPGVHNLDPDETNQRRMSGWLGFIVTVIAAASFAYFHVAPPWRLLIFFPATLGALGFLQARSKFCVMVALSSLSPATNAPDRAKDRSRALGMIGVALVIGAVIAAGAYFA